MRNLLKQATPERRVVAFAVATRALVTLLALLTARLATPYDTSARLAPGGGGIFAHLANWDGVFFTQIATRGYEFEHVHAFFPLYPLLMRALSSVLALLALPSPLVLSGWLISNGSFVLAALWLYWLGRLVLADEAVARRAAFLFCVAPSSIFMSAVYTESLMCALSFGGMLCLERHKRNGRFSELLLSAVAFGCASATRSNGVLLSLFIAWHRLRVSPSLLASPVSFVRHWSATALLGIIAVGPQVAYFVYGMSIYCPSLFPASAGAVAAPSQLLTKERPWCAKVIPNFSAMYMFVQSEYWNIGLFKYYELKQIPNFLLAAPIIALSGYSLLRFFRLVARGHKTKTTDTETPYYVHWLFLLVNALLVVHIQVTTRLLCACPPLFWAPAAFAVRGAISKDNDSPDAPSMSRKGKLVVGYFLLYTVLGSVLFPTFYPWT